MGCDGTSQVNLTNHSSEDKQPSWGPGGTLAFSSNRSADGGFDIYLLTLNPWGIVRVTSHTANDEAPAISPDGSKIAFVSYRDGNAEIYVASVAMGTPTVSRITNDSSSDVDPAWDSDGNRLAFASDRDGDWEIYLTDSNLANPSKLTNNTSNDRWPDLADYFGDELVAFASDRDGDWEIFTMYDDGSEQLQSTLNSAAEQQPSWDPLAEYMAINSDRDSDIDSGGDLNLDVATMYYDGAENTNITKAGFSDSGNSNESSPDWEPVNDGKYCGD